MAERTGEYQEDHGQETSGDPNALHGELGEVASDLMASDAQIPPEGLEEESPQERAARLAGRVGDTNLIGRDEQVGSEQVGANLDRIASGDSETPSYMTNSFLNGVEANLDRVDQENQQRRAGELEEKARTDQERQEKEDRAADEKRHRELGHERYSYGGTGEELKTIRGERARAELEALPLTEMTPEMVESVQAAVERGIAPIDMPEDLKVLAGVRIDDIGTFGVVNPELSFDISPAEKQRIDYLADFHDRILPRVGTYATNNRTLTYVDHMGRIFTAPSTDVLGDALRDAGYSYKEGMVYCSNADAPADADRIVDLFVAREVGDHLSILQGLKKLGIDKTEEQGDLVAGIRSNIENTPNGYLIKPWKKGLGMILDPEQRPAPVVREVEDTTEYAGRA